MRGDPPRRFLPEEGPDEPFLGIAIGEDPAGVQGEVERQDDHRPEAAPNAAA